MGRCFTLVAIAVTLASPLLAVQPRVLHTLEPVLVTANPWYVPAARLGFKSQSITQEAIQETGALEIGDVMNTLTNSDAVDSGHQNSIFIRGLPSRFSKVLVNGMDMKDPIDPNGSPFWDGLNLGTIDGIQYVEGSQGALVGASAVTGVLNFLSAPTGFESTIKAADRYYSAGIKTGHSVGNWLWSLAINRDSDKRYSSTTASSTPDIDDYFANNVFARLAWDDAHFHFATQALIIDSQALLDSYGSDSILKTNSRRYGTELEWQSTPLEKLGIRYNLGTVRREDILSPTIYTADLHTIDSFAQWTIGNTIALIGIDYQIENGQNTGGYSQTQFRTQNTASIYSGATHQLGNWTLNESFRINSDYRSRIGLVGGIGITVSLNNTLAIRSNINSGVRTASLYENANTVTDLSPENATSTDLGIWGDFGWIKGHVSGYYSAISDRIKDKYPQPDYNLTYVNLSGVSTVKGVEIGTEIPGVIRVSYTRTNTDTASLGEDARVPRFKWIASTGYTLGPIALSAQFQSVGLRRDTLYSNTQLSEYALTDVTAKYTGIANWIPFTSVTNVFDEKYVQAGGYTTPGRTFILGLTYRVD